MISFCLFLWLRIGLDLITIKDILRVIWLPLAISGLKTHLNLLTPTGTLHIITSAVTIYQIKLRSIYYTPHIAAHHIPYKILFIHSKSRIWKKNREGKKYPFRLKRSDDDRKQKGSPV